MSESSLDIKNIIGHSRILTPLLRALEQHRFPHALLFVGAEGIGKHRTARSLASALLLAAATPHERPRVTERLLHGTHQDCITLDPEWGVKTPSSTIKIEAIRRLEERVRVGSYESDTLVILIDPAHEMTPSAANALLKTLEEPPPGTYFFLISSSPARLLPTVRSRCQILRFAPLSPEEITAILSREAPELSAAQVKRVIPLAEGSAGRALSYANSEEFQLMEELATQFLQTILSGTMLEILHLAEELGSLDKGSYTRFLPIVESKIRATTATALTAPASAPARKYDINGWLEALERGKRDLAGNVNRRLLSEHLLWTMRKK